MQNPTSASQDADPVAIRSFRGTARILLLPRAMKHRSSAAPFIACIAAAACGGSQAAGTAVASPSQAVQADPSHESGAGATVAWAGAQGRAPSVDGDGAHRLLVSAAACWLGGMWTDAQGVDDADRAAASERGCRDLVRQAHGGDDLARYERLRALDAVEVSDLVQTIAGTAIGEGLAAEHAQRLAKLVGAIADAERETMYARRAADRVKKDLEGERTPSKLTDDEIAAVNPLGGSRAFEDLLHLDVDGLSHEARVFAILCAMQRMEIARGLPKHLKIYAVQRPYAMIFGVPVPAVPTDATKPLPGGAWLRYLTTAAKAAGHAVPAGIQSLRDRELVAWGGVVMGFADKLRDEAIYVSDETDLKQVADAVVQRLEIEYRASRAATLHASAPAAYRDFEARAQGPSD